jgi:hypothetical protein
VRNGLITPTSFLIEPLVFLVELLLTPTIGRMPIATRSANRKVLGNL